MNYFTIMTDKYCMNCKKTVGIKKSFNWGYFLIFGVFYLMIWSFQQGKCPICNTGNWKGKEPVKVNKK